MHSIYNFRSSVRARHTEKHKSKQLSITCNLRGKRNREREREDEDEDEDGYGDAAFGERKCLREKHREMKR